MKERVFKRKSDANHLALPGHGLVQAGTVLVGDKYAYFCPKFLEEITASYYASTKPKAARVANASAPTAELVKSIEKSIDEEILAELVSTASGNVVSQQTEPNRVPFPDKLTQLPDSYDDMRATDVVAWVEGYRGSDPSVIELIYNHELATKNRKTVIRACEERLTR